MLVKCRDCWGRGLISITVEEDCRPCNATGGYGDQICVFCKGNGKQESKKDVTCDTCHGNGKVEDYKKQPGTENTPGFGPGNGKSGFGSFLIAFVIFIIVLYVLFRWVFAGINL